MNEQEEAIREAAACRYLHDATFNRMVSTAKLLLQQGDEAGFVALLDQVAGSDWKRIEQLTELAQRAERLRPIIIQTGERRAV